MVINTVALFIHIIIIIIIISEVLSFTVSDSIYICM
jgi:hypothetical protein